MLVQGDLKIMMVSNVSFRWSLNLNIFGVFENVLEKKTIFYSADYKKVRGHARFKTSGGYPRWEIG